VWEGEVYLQGVAFTLQNAHSCKKMCVHIFMCVILLVLIMLGIDLILHNNVNHIDCNFSSLFNLKF
jgi:hypothetical protein